jgi:hypothetical protein
MGQLTEAHITRAHITPCPRVEIDEGDLYGAVQKHQVNSNGQSPQHPHTNRLVSMAEEPLGEAMGYGREMVLQKELLWRGNTHLVSHFPRRRCRSHTSNSGDAPLDHTSLAEGSWMGNGMTC